MSSDTSINYYYDPATGTFSYLVVDNQTNDCVVIDPVLSYDMVSGNTDLGTISPVIKEINQQNLNLVWILETHAHADHLTAAKQLKEHCQGQIAIGTGIVDIQKQFKVIYGFGDEFDTSGDAFDRLLSDGDKLIFGEQEIKVIATPGHTRDSLTFKINEYLFIGDTLFHPELGTARCDFPGGDATLLFESINKILSHDDNYTLCLCHDYPGTNRDAEPFIKIRDMRSNVHLVKAEGNSEEFVKIRENRDKDLALPKLIIPSIQINCQAGLDDGAEEQHLVWPINRF